MKPALQGLLITFAATFPAVADYEVDVDLGPLPEGNTEISGTTALVGDLSPPAELSDDFDDGVLDPLVWTTTGGGTVVEAGGTVTTTGGGVLHTLEGFEGSLEINLRAKLNSDSEHLKIAFRSTMEALEFGERRGLVATFSNDENQISFHEMGDDDPFLLAARTYPLDTDQYYDLTIRDLGSSLELWIDGSLELTTKTTFAPGNLVGFYSRESGNQGAVTSSSIDSFSFNLAVMTGGRNNADLVAGEGLDLNTAGNWGNEYVIQFTLAEPANLTFSKDSEFAEGDPDFFLVEGLRTEFDVDLGKNVAQEGIWYNFFDALAPDQDSLVLRTGTYYLVVESFVGFDGAVNQGDATFSLNLNVLPALWPDEVKIDLGVIGGEGSPLTFDTFGSGFDTQLAIFSFDGNLIQENDNAGEGLQSQVSLPEGLDTGTYIAVVAGAGAIFDLGPITTTGGAVGDVVFNYPSNPNLGPEARTATTTTSTGTEASETVWFEFAISLGPPREFVDLGKIGDPGVPLQLHTLESLVDTQLAIYDEFGYFLYYNDDASGTLQSLIDIPEGLTEGVWFAVVGGYPSTFLDGFEVAAGAAGGAYSLTHPNGIVPMVLEPNKPDWYRFEVGDPGNGGGNDPARIQITSLTFNPATNEFTVDWDGALPGPFSIQMGSAKDLEAIDPQDNVLPVTAAVGLVASPVTLRVPESLELEPKVFLQVIGIDP